MSTDAGQDQQQGDNDSTVTLKRSQIRALEDAAKDNERLTKELETMKRDSAFKEAGVDLSDPKIPYFVKGYTGELTPEAIKKAAEEAGFIAPPTLSPEQQAALDASAASSSAAAGAAPLSTGSPEGMRAEMEKALETGGKEALLAVATRYGAKSEDDFR